MVAHDTAWSVRVTGLVDATGEEFLSRIVNGHVHQPKGVTLVGAKSADGLVGVL